MRAVILASVLAVIGSTDAVASDRIGETCSGMETVQLGTQPPKTMPYSLTFSADLSIKSYCYDRCGADQTYPLADAAADPIELADIDADDSQVGSQKRRITYDRHSGTLTDFQSMNLGGLGTVVRKATAKCRPSAFHEPAPLPDSQGN